MIKKLLWIFLASPTQRIHQETFWILFRELLLINFSKRVYGNVLFLLWFRTIKTLDFTITHISLISEVSMYHLGLYSEPCQTSKVERSPKIVNNFFTVNYIHETPQFRYLRVMDVNTPMLLHKFSMGKETHSNKRFTFFLKGFSRWRLCGWWVKVLVHKFLSLLLNEFLQTKIMQKSRSVQNITKIIAVADE